MKFGVALGCLEIIINYYNHYCYDHEMLVVIIPDDCSLHKIVSSVSSEFYPPVSPIIRLQRVISSNNDNFF